MESKFQVNQLIIELSKGNCIGHALKMARKNFPGDSDSKASAYNVGDLGSIPGSGRSLKKGMITNSSTLAWRIPWTEEPDGQQSMRLQRVRHN